MKGPEFQCSCFGDEDVENQAIKWGVYDCVGGWGQSQKQNWSGEVQCRLRSQPHVASESVRSSSVLGFLHLLRAQLLPGELLVVVLRTSAPNCTSQEVQMTQLPTCLMLKWIRVKLCEQIHCANNWQLPGYQREKYKVIVAPWGHGGRALNCHYEVWEVESKAKSLLDVKHLLLSLSLSCHRTGACSPHRDHRIVEKGVAITLTR